MSPAARLSLVDRADSAVSIMAQCQLLKVARSTLYYRPAPVSDEDLAVMRRIDEHYLATPFYGSRRMVAVMDWFSRRVLAWRLSIGMDTAFCVEAAREAMDRHGPPDVFNTDQGAQFTSADFVGELETRGVRISMDGKGRYLDNIFIERLWRSLKYEDIYIKAYATVPAARGGVGAWLTFYNDERPHQALNYLTPRAVFEAAACGYVDNAPVALRSTSALPTCPQAQH
jgi:putative transposase